MSESRDIQATRDGGEVSRSGRNRLRALLREMLFIVAIVGIYLAVMLFVLPRLGYET